MAAPPEDEGDGEAEDITAGQMNGHHQHETAVPVPRTSRADVSAKEIRAPSTLSAEYPVAVVPAAVKSKRRKRRNVPIINDSAPPPRIATTLPPQAVPPVVDTKPEHPRANTINGSREEAVSLTDAKESLPIPTPTIQPPPQIQPQPPQLTPQATLSPPPQLTPQATLSPALPVVEEEDTTPKDDFTAPPSPNPPATLHTPSTIGLEVPQSEERESSFVEEENLMNQTILQWEKAEKALLESNLMTPTPNQSTELDIQSLKAVEEDKKESKTEDVMREAVERKKEKEQAGLDEAAPEDNQATTTTPTTTTTETTEPPSQDLLPTNNEVEEEEVLDAIEVEKKRLLDTLIARGKERLKQIEEELARTASSAKATIFPSAATPAPTPTPTPVLVTPVTATPKTTTNLSTTSPSLPAVSTFTPNATLSASSDAVTMTTSTFPAAAEFRSKRPRRRNVAEIGGGDEESGEAEEEVRKAQEQEREKQKEADEREKLEMEKERERLARQALERKEQEEREERERKRNQQESEKEKERKENEEIQRRLKLEKLKMGFISGQDESTTTNKPERANSLSTWGGYTDPSSSQLGERERSKTAAVILQNSTDLTSPLIQPREVNNTWYPPPPICSFSLNSQIFTPYLSQ